MWYNALLMLIICFAHAYSAENCGCSNPDSANATTCYILMNNFEKALTSNEANLYTLRTIFFPSCAQRPELVNVTYRLQFTNPATDLPNCSCATNTTNRSREFIEPGQTLTVRYGWTIIGLYTLIHPALLNQIQFPLPFSVMRLVSADNVPFLWNGHVPLPTVEVALNIDTNDLTCLPDIQQVDETLKMITSLLQFYAQSGGSEGTLGEVDFALDGQFVSNWVDLNSINSTDNSIIGTETVFLRRDVNDVTEVLLLPHYTVFISAPVILFLVCLYTFSYMHDNCNRLESQSFPLLISLFLCLSFFGIITIMSELSSWDNSNPPHIKAKYVFVFLFVAIDILMFFIVAFVVIYIIAAGKTTGWTLAKQYNFLFSAVILLLLPPGLFAVLWFIICSYSTLMFGLAYPLHTFSLAVLHMAFVYVIIVAYAIVIAKVWKKTKKRTTIISFISFCLFLVVYICIIYVGIIIAFFLMFVRGYIRTDGAPSPDFILILPSVALFFIGWLLKRFFDDSGSSIRKEIHSLINDLPLTISKRLNLGKKLGIPPSKLREIEVEALKEQKQRKATALQKMIDYWFENNPKANYEKFLVILSSDQEYLVTAEQHYTPQELIGKVISSTQIMRETLKKLYPSFASRAMTMEEAPDSRDKWLAIDNWIKQRHVCTWSELVNKLDKNDLDSRLLRNYLFETETPTIEELN